MWPEASHGDSHGAHGAHGDEEHEEHEEHEGEEESKDEPQEEEAPKEEESAAEEPKEESKSDDGPAEESKDEPEGDDDKQTQSRDTPAEGKNMPEDRGNTKDVSFKGPIKSEDGSSTAPDERKREPDSKGAFKKRIDSGIGKNLGEGPAKADDGRVAVGVIHELRTPFAGH